ncbi:MAG TPA: sigma-54-dependent Fis family transcriptional regulator [Polyangiaceae bacterium]|nr:sigma-54-dependent Fis family transcriptional regulator [Polyangiaceae bacterium]
MTVEMELHAATISARLGLERWDVLRARKDAERARALASTLGDSNAVRLSDALLARTRLLCSSDPRQIELASMPAAEALASDPGLHAAVWRLKAELAAATTDPNFRVEPITPQQLSLLDAAAAFAIGGVLALQSERHVPRIYGPTPALDTLSLEGWQHVLIALSLETSGGSGWSAIEQALTFALAQDRKALAWTALRLRLVMSEQRTLRAEARVTRERLARLCDEWMLSLPKAEALSARMRADRLELTERDADDGKPGLDLGSLADTAIALAHERDIDTLVNLTLDAAIAATHAERGLLILRSEDGSYRVGATRYIDHVDDERATWGLSSTIVRAALDRAEAVVSNDVRRDPRFADSASAANSITSVLCVPIHARAEIEGALYLDRRVGRRPFERASISAARALGSLLAGSLLNSRVLAALESRAKELEAARAELVHALASRTAERDDMNRQLAKGAIAPRGSSALIGSSPTMKRLRQHIDTVAVSDAPILIAGETGSGKELVARAVHAASPRRDRPFVAINCGALSESLLAAELFGSSRGAYTGSTTARPGLLVTADRGTVFLDEVGDMPPSMQTVLLRVLETSEVRPVGSHESRKIDVRILAASHRDLLELVRQGKFRDDLRYRLEVVRIEVPPLRARLDDLPELCAALLEDVRARYSLPDRQLSSAALHALRTRQWAGNVRELRHALASAALASRGPLIEPADLPAERIASNLPEVEVAAESEEVDGHALRAESIRRALKATAGHRGRAAKLLGMSRSSLYRYCETYGIEIDSVAQSSSALIGRKLSAT